MTPSNPKPKLTNPPVFGRGVVPGPLARHEGTENGVGNLRRSAAESRAADGTPLRSAPDYKPEDEGENEGEGRAEAEGATRTNLRWFLTRHTGGPVTEAESPVRCVVIPPGHITIGGWG
jgi:hypothetical protein